MTGNSSTRTPFTIGLLVTELTLPAWQVRMLERIRSEGLARIAVVVVRSIRRAEGLGTTLERHALDGSRVANDAFAPVDARQLFAGAEIVRAAPPASASTLSAADVGRLTAHHLDVLLHLGGDLPSGLALDCARLGIWSYWSGDAPEAFWETYENRDVIRTTLWRLAHEGAEPLYESTSSVDATCVAITRNRAYWKAAAFVPRVLRRLERTNCSPLAVPRVQLPARNRPSALSYATFAVKRFLRRRHSRFLKRFSREQWQLLFGLGPAALTNYEHFARIVPPADLGWADPHVVVRDGRHYLFIEEYSYRKRRGHIAVMEIREDGTYSEPTAILERPYHLSYPHVFEWNGELYMVPESKENRTVELYRCSEFPHRWQLETTLMENVEAVDATLLEHGGRWWLFANLIENAGGSSWDELFLFSADSPVSREWTPHPANPIVSDVSRARPAGKIFIDEGRLYRPSQDCSRRYGYALNFSEIVMLDETRYEERVVTRLQPDWDPTLLATHSLARGGALTVIDGQRRRWRLPLEPSMWRERLCRLRNALSPPREPPRIPSL